jgi:hypothetical protein
MSLLGLAKMGVKYDELDEEDRLAIQAAVMKNIRAMNKEEEYITRYS